MITKRDDILSAIKVYMSQINLQHTIYTVIRNYGNPYEKWNIFVARTHNAV